MGHSGSWKRGNTDCDQNVGVAGPARSRTQGLAGPSTAPRKGPESSLAEQIYIPAVIFITIDDSCDCHSPQQSSLRNVYQKTNTYSPKKKKQGEEKRGRVFLHPYWCGLTHYSNVIRRTLNISKVSSLFHGWLSSWEQRVYCEKSKQWWAIRGKHYLRNGSWDAQLHCQRDYHYNT